MKIRERGNTSLDVRGLKEHDNPKGICGPSWGHGANRPSAKRCFQDNWENCVSEDTGIYYKGS